MTFTTRPAGVRRAAMLGLAAAVACSAGSASRSLVIADVAVVDVEDGIVRQGQTVVILGDRIVRAGHSTEIEAPPGARRIDGTGRYLIPGLWDMHTHAHRDGRAAWHYPAYLAHGVTGIRDMGTYLDSAMAARRAWSPAADVPTVWWGSPVVDGDPPVLSHGLVAASPAAVTGIVSLMSDSGFSFIKVYDRLDRETYFALAAAARTAGIPFEGHVPLAVTPAEAAAAGQGTIEHLTLVLEACIPGVLDWVAADSTGDSMGLLSDGRLAAALDGYDPAVCAGLFRQLAAAGVRQVPTLVQMRGAFLARDSAFGADPRLASVPEGVRRDWEAYRTDTPAAVFEAGAAVYRRQVALVGEMFRAGVIIMAGTDASDEPWVFPGASLHDELALLVDAGLPPIDALRAATLHPARYRGVTGRLIAEGAMADLVLLRADPTRDIRATSAIDGVVLRGRLLPR